MRAQGFVDLQMGNTRVQADLVDYYITTEEDGTESHRLVAEGNVVFVRVEERVAGDRLEMDVDTGQGTFTNARGFVDPGLFVEGRTIERVDAKTYHVLGGAKFTSCAQPSPRWSFSASSARLEVNDKIVAKNVVFKVKDVPAFYLPVILYPIRHDQRSTGFLLPHVGYSSYRGFNLGDGFFWAMGRSFDQTFYADSYSNFGYGLGNEFRYLLPSPSRGTFRTYAFKPRGGGPWDYDLDYSALEMFPGNIRASLLVRQYSNLLFQQRFQDNLNFASTRTRRSSLNVQKSLGSTTVQLLADSTDTFFGDHTRLNRHLPTLRISRFPQKLGHSGIVFGYEARAEELGTGDSGGVTRYSRLDLSPELSRPMSVPFLSVTPKVGLHYTRYGTQELFDDQGNATGLGGSPLERRFFEGSVDMRGPTFSRVFNTPGNFYSDKFKHVIGPEFTYTYRTAIENFNAIPKFDGQDYFLGTNQISYGLVQRFLAKRPSGASGKLVPYEFLSWRLGQTYYVQVNEGQSEFDPNFASVVFGPGGGAAHFSPVQSRLQFRPAPAVSSNFDVEYDVNFHEVRTLGLSGALNTSRASFQAGWSRGRQLAQREERRVITLDTVRTAARVNLLPNRLSLQGSADYDILGKTMVQSSGRLRYEVQCCGFMVEVIQFNFNQRSERQFRFSIELANIGSIGNFMGQNAALGGQRGSGPAPLGPY